MESGISMRLLGLALVFAWPLTASAQDQDADRQWLAGDHHVHSEWSVDWDDRTSPPTPIRGGDSPYSRSRNAQQALANGLRWMVHTDHGGPGHSQVSAGPAWEALVQARRDVPDLIQFNGMEFDVPAGEHASLIIAPGADERGQLLAIERDYSRGEPLPPASRDSHADMLAALRHMQGLATPPLMFINHPSRTATGIGQWGEVEPDELRVWHDAAPGVLVGMEGAPGHQAAPKHRGLYRNAAAPTLGGFDQMTAQVGGVWDGLLSQGRRFWITATSDSHINLRDGGRDFDPGQYSKTYVWARPQAEDILHALRNGRMFAVTGDLIDALELRVSTAGEPLRVASMGQSLEVCPGQRVAIELRVRTPVQANAHGQRPQLDHVELILGEAGAEAPQMHTRRYGRAQLRRDGDWWLASWEVEAPNAGGFVRARGSNTADATPAPDQDGEDPWSDLWFYSNPVFLQGASSPP